MDVPPDHVLVVSSPDDPILFAANPKWIYPWANANHSSSDACLMAPDEVTGLQKLAKDHTIVEIGSFRGGSAHFMMEAGAIHLTCIDPHEDVYWADQTPDLLPAAKGADVQADFVKAIAPYGDRITYLQMYSDAAAKVPIPPCDLLFIDGLHTYEQCLADLRNFVPKLAPRWVAVHDHCLLFPGVLAACMNFFHRRPTYQINTLAIYEMRS